MAGRHPRCGKVQLGHLPEVGALIGQGHVAVVKTGRKFLRPDILGVAMQLGTGT